VFQLLVVKGLINPTLREVKVQPGVHNMFLSFLHSSHQVYPRPAFLLGRRPQPKEWAWLALLVSHCLLIRATHHHALTS